MIAAIDPSDPAPFADIPLLANRNMIDDQPTVYLCERHSCQMPANNPKSHQVNALLKTPGGYRNRDYLRAGSGLTVVFLLVVVTYFYFYYI